jgi:hypothetical protein
MAVDIKAPTELGATFQGLVKVAVNQTVTLGTWNNITFKGRCTPSTEDSTQNVASLTVATEAPGTMYSSLNFIGGSVVEINPADGDVVVASYDAGCDEPGGPFYCGGIAFSLSKPNGFAMNGVLSLGVGVLGGDAVFSAMFLYSQSDIES